MKRQSSGDALNGPVTVQVNVALPVHMEALVQRTKRVAQGESRVAEVHAICTHMTAPLTALHPGARTMVHLSSSVVGAVVFSGAFLGAVPVAQAATHVVANCADTGAGSLRDAVAMAATGDTVDARNLRCGSIALARRIDVPQANLTVLGPGTARLAIDANFADRLFLHTGRGVRCPARAR